MNLSSSGGNSSLNCLFFGTFFFGFFMARDFAGLPREWVYVILLSFSLFLSPSVYQFAALSTIYSLDLSSRARSYVDSFGFVSCSRRRMAHVSPCIARSPSHSGTQPGRWAASASTSQPAPGRGGALDPGVTHWAGLWSLCIPTWVHLVPITSQGPDS